MIDVKEITFRYQEDQEQATLDKVSFHVKPGEWFSIVGHNGSGKSTTARLLDGLLAAESGKIIIDGQKLTEETVWDIRHKIGMVFQNPDNQFVGATVEDDVAFGLENQGLPLDVMKERVNEALELVDMADFKTREPARLSGGQKQRVAIAGALAMRPKVIIFDESTSMLDPEGRADLIVAMKRIRQEFGMTVISITHDLDEIALSDRVMVLKEGQVVSITEPDRLFEKEEELDVLGLAIPFSQQLRKALIQKGLAVSNAYQTAEELEEHLWELLSNK